MIIDAPTTRIGNAPHVASTPTDVRLRRMLACGIIAGPFYLVVGLVQALTREGFDFARHALSHLANGAWGWVQTANFLISGLMVVAAAIGIRRMLRPVSRASGWVLGVYGVSMIAAAIFRADPVDGFPPGTPLGMPTEVSISGVLHFVAGGIGFLALAISCFVIGAAFRRAGVQSVANLSFLSGAGVLLGFFAPMAIPAFSLGIAGIWFAVVVGWLWLSLTSAHLLSKGLAP